MIFDADDEVIRGYYEEDKSKSTEKRRCQAVRVRISPCYVFPFACHRADGVFLRVNHKRIRGT